jgi:hypothetical protein
LIKILSILLFKARSRSAKQMTSSPGTSNSVKTEQRESTPSRRQ